MNRLLLTAISAALAMTCFGCKNMPAAKTKPTVTTGLAENREERMNAIADNLKSKGYSEDRAKQVAAKQVPLVETTYSESVSSVMTGAAEKRKTKQAKFAKDLAKSMDNK